MIASAKYPFLLCRPQPQKMCPSTLVFLNIFETNTVNCLQTTLCESSRPTVSCDWYDLLLIQQMIYPKCCWKSEADPQLSSVAIRFCKTSQILQGTSNMESLLPKTVSPQACNCTLYQKGHYHWRFPGNIFTWTCSFIFTFLFQEGQKQPPGMFCEKR